ncbi:MAG: hypothetical protein J6X66_11015 [Lachnospiraceae bacterium]|nr:hypothetical protein [Lachnospiraceae bacterium]
MNKTKALALSGLFAALAVICLILADTLLINSSGFCFIIAAFLCGYTAELSKMPFGIGCAAAAFLLGLIISPYKLHCLTFLGLAVFILICQYILQRSRTDKPLGRIKAWIITILSWNVFLAAGIALYSIFIGNISELTAGTVFDSTPLPLFIALMIIVLEALGPVIYIAYGQFINFMDRIVRRIL